MNKIKEQYENPIDNIIYKAVGPTLPIFHSLNFTPNGITTLSLLSGLTSCCYLFNKQFIPFAIMYLISYYLDFMDGAYARTYNMTSEFGDWYDHIKDWTISLLVLYIFINKYNLMKNNELILIIVTMCFLLAIHMGCQEKMYGKDDSGALDMTKKMCPAHTKEELEQIMPYTRLFGNGTFILSQIGVAYLLLK